MRKCRKRAITLLEVMIALSLTSILLSFVFATLKRNIFLKTYLKTAQSEIFARSNVQESLIQIFNQIDPHFSSEKGISLLTKFNESAGLPELTFFYDNGIDATPELSGFVKGTLFIKENTLSISIESLKRKEIQRTTHLLHNVSSVAFSFLDPDSYNQKTRILASEWNKPEFPVFIELAIMSEEKEPLTWVFFFYPLLENPINFKLKK